MFGHHEMNGAEWSGPEQRYIPLFGNFMTEQGKLFRHNGVERSRMEQSGTKIPFHCLESL